MPRLLLALALLPFLGASTPPPAGPPDPAAFAGTWTLDAERSTAIDPWYRLTVEITPHDDGIDLVRAWRGSREGGAFRDSMRVVPGETVRGPAMGQWPDARHLGAYIAGDSTRTVETHWEDDGRTLVTESHVTLSVQQGTTSVRTYTEYRLSPEGDRLDVLELRSTRPRPLRYVFVRADA